MARLSKAQTKLHNQALDYLSKDVLTYDEKIFVIENWNEGANTNNSELGAFFTPFDYANDFSLEIFGDNVIDLCAGIGVLSFCYYHFRHWNEPIENKPKITCVELNHSYVEVGKKILPEANWIHANVLTDWKEFGKFDFAYSNPPFGNIRSEGSSPNYTGSQFEYKVVDIANELSDGNAAFIMPQTSAPFKFSGNRGYLFDGTKNTKYKAFHEQTGIHLDAGIGIDGSLYTNEWKNTNVLTEVVNIVER